MPDDPLLLLLPRSVDLWWLRFDDVLPEFFTPLLAADEQQRAARFHLASDRHRYITTRGVLRTLLGRYLRQPPDGLRFTYTMYGKPLLATGSLHFSVAHSGNLALLGVSRRPVGVDVEALQPRLVWRDVAPLVFNAPEQAWIAGHPPDGQLSAFFTLWTRKEAFLKARGDGFSGDPTRVTVLESVDGVRTDDASQQWRIVDVPTEAGYRAALCCEATLPLS